MLSGSMPRPGCPAHVRRRRDWQHGRRLRACSAGLWHVSFSEYNCTIYRVHLPLRSEPVLQCPYSLAAGHPVAPRCRHSADGDPWPADPQPHGLPTVPLRSTASSAGFRRPPSSMPARHSARHPKSAADHAGTVIKSARNARSRCARIREATVGGTMHYTATVYPAGSSARPWRTIES